MQVPTFLKSRRLWGLTGTALVLYLLIFVVFGHIDISGIVPRTDRIAQAIIDVWPRMPFFSVEQETRADGKTETYYTVPTRQITRAELAQMQKTNQTSKPAPPK